MRDRVISVALPLPVRKTFSYRVPESLPRPEPGSRVRVPFGERALTGVVVADAAAPEGDEPARLRNVIEVLDPEPVCPPDLLSTAARVAERFFASPGEVFKSVLPARLPAAGALRYRVTEKGALARASGPEKEILERLSSGEAVRASELPGSARQDVLRDLEARGWIRALSPDRPERPRSEVAWAPVPLSPERRKELLGRSRRGPAVLAWLDGLGRP